MPGDDAPDSENEVVYDEDDEEDEEMEDVPPATVKMETLVPDDYDEEAPRPPLWPRQRPTRTRIGPG